MIYIRNHPREEIFYDEMVSTTLFESPINKQHGLLKAHTESFGNNNTLLILNPSTVNLNFSIARIEPIRTQRRINIVQAPRFGNDSGLVLIYIQFTTNKAYIETLKKIGYR